MELDDLVVRMRENCLEISGDPRMLRDICALLQGFGRLAHYLGKKLEHLQAEQRALTEAEKREHVLAYEERASNIYRRYKYHLDNGCQGNKKESVKTVRQEFSLLVVDAMNYIAEGRRLEKREMQRKAAA